MEQCDYNNVLGVPLLALRRWTGSSNYCASTFGNMILHNTLWRGGDDTGIMVANLKILHLIKGKS